MPRFKLLLLLNSALLLISCSTPTISGLPTHSAATNAPDVSASVCAVLKPIYYDRLKDTEATIAQVKSYNAGIIVLCPQYAPKN